MLKTHTVKSNAKRAARKLCDQFSGIEVAEPVDAPDGSGNFVPAVRLIAGVLPSSIAPEVAQAANLELPEGWTVDRDGSVKRAAVAPAPAAEVKMRAGGRRDEVFALLRRPEGATVAQIIESTGWAPHTTRAFISVQARKLGLEVKTEKTEAGRVYRVVEGEQVAA